MTRIIKWIAVIGAAALIIGLFIYNTQQTPDKVSHTDSEAWHSGMTMGSADAPNTFVDYTDYFCSFCTDIYNAMGDQFKKDYVDTGLVRYEHRVVSVLESVSPNAVQGAEAAYCAADQNKYWEYSASIIPRIETDYFKKGIGVKNVANPIPIAELPLEYFSKSAEAAKLDVDEFETCMTDHSNEPVVRENTSRALQLGVQGLPYLVVNDYVSNGFAGGYENVELILKAGGVSK